MRSRRAATSGTERAAGGEAVATRLAALPLLGGAHHIAGYAACGGEVPVWPLATICLARGQNWYLPTLADGDDRMRFAPWSPGCPMEAGRFAIPQPAVPVAGQLDGSALDVVLVPLVAFDRRGHRLGNGGGFYDRSFAHLIGVHRPARPLLVGVAWTFQEAELTPEPWDVDLDWIITEREVIQCHA